MRTREGLCWPAKALPEIKVCGLFPLLVEQNSVTYLLPRSHAIHLYLYEAQVTIAGRLYDVAPGDITLTPAGVPSSYFLEKNGKHWCAHFATGRGGGAAVRLPAHIRGGGASRRILETFQSLVYYFNLAPADAAARELSLHMAGLLLGQILTEIAAGQTLESGLRPTLAGTYAEGALEKLAGIIEEKLAEKLTVAGLAREVGLSQNYLARLFRARYGQTIQRYLLTRRMGKALHYLRNSNMPVKSIAALCGVADPQHFNKSFRKQHGQSPTRYRSEAGGGKRRPNRKA